MKRHPLASLTLLLLPAAAIAQDDGAAQLEFFEREIRPIIHNHCYECHSVQAGKQKGGLLLDSKWGWETGGDSGPAIIPGNLDASLLIDAVRRSETTVDAMPPKSILSSDAISKLEQWVKMGAPDPRPKVESEVTLVEEFNLEGRFEEHWCWRPVQNPEPPAMNQTGWPSHPIDHFVLARIEAAGLVPAEPADQRTWLRRVYFDLIGLPPTPQQIAEFLEHGSEEQVVDELLASPHFGEKWARHMLDLVRYAETCGHEFDYPIPHAHRYRDYVIRALNADVPYDDFIREHVAGDLLEQPRLHPDTHTNESIIGTGFWYLHEATHAPTDVRQDEADHLDSQIDVFTKTFQALTVACARCHDHKFDAISTADYYALTGYIKGSCRTEFPLDPHDQIALANAHLRELRVQATDELRHISSDAIGPGASLLAAIELIREEQANRRDRDPWAGELFEDFDSGYDGWTIEGGAFGDAPAAGAFDGQGELAGFRGSGLVNTWNGDDKLVGEATSAAFEITKPYINFLIGGGAHEHTVFELRIGNQVVHSKSGQNAESLEPATFDVTEHIGKPGVFHIRDRELGSWGHLNLDHIVFSDTAAVNETTPRHSAESIASAAGKRGVPEAHLNSWIEILTAEPDKDASALQKFFTEWMGQPGALAQRQSQVRSTRKQLAEFRNNSELFADFGPGQIPEGWTTTGSGFDGTSNAAGLSFAGDVFSTPGSVSTRTGGVNQVGTLRSHSFESDVPRIFIRARTKDIVARVVIDNYHMAIYQPLLYGGTVKRNNEVDSRGQFQWIRLDGNLDKYTGETWWLEIIDSGTGSAEIAEVRISAEASPPTEIHPVLDLSLGSDADIETAEDFARELDRAWSESLAAVRDGSATDSHTSFLNWSHAHGFLADDQLPGNVPALIAEGRQVAESIPVPEFAVAMVQGTPQDGQVYIRGGHGNLGETVPNRYLEALGSVEGDRMVLANQVADESNPLTSRVAVNRIWHHLFGRGIVPTVDDFGPMGMEPSHPELLDWLATDFVSNGWSQKHTIRQIVLSSTYGQASTIHPKLDPSLVESTDPSNLLLHRMPVRRLQSEAIRDAILAVSGRLDPALFGDPVPTHRTSFMTGRGARGSGPLDGGGRRSIYGAIYRNFLSPFMLTFDTPGPFGPKGRRSVSNVPAQALVLMNDPFVVAMARHWSGRLGAGQPADARIRTMFESALGRVPTDDEVARLTEFVESQAGLKKVPKNDLTVWEDVAHALINTKEFIYLR